MDKKEIRKNIIKMRDELTLERRMVLDNRILESVLELNRYQQANMIFLFLSFGSEVDTKRLIERALAKQKRICVPRVISRQAGMLPFEIIGLQDVEPGHYGILEPKNGCRLVELTEIDLVLMPGVAFDRSGGRIGYGGGYYDRLFAKAAYIAKIALAYEMQVLETLPLEEHDIRIDGLVTEKDFSEFSSLMEEK